MRACTTACAAHWSNGRQARDGARANERRSRVHKTCLHPGHGAVLSAAFVFRRGRVGPADALQKDDEGADAPRSPMTHCRGTSMFMGSLHGMSASPARRSGAAASTAVFIVFASSATTRWSTRSAPSYFNGKLPSDRPDVVSVGYFFSPNVS
jgi:hypothetical protein